MVCPATPVFCPSRAPSARETPRVLTQVDFGRIRGRLRGASRGLRRRGGASGANKKRVGRPSQNVQPSSHLYGRLFSIPLTISAGEMRVALYHPAADVERASPRRDPPPPTSGIGRRRRALWELEDARAHPEAFLSDGESHHVSIRKSPRPRRKSAKPSIVRAMGLVANGGNDGRTR